MASPEDELEIELLRHAMVPLVDEHGKPRRFAPFAPHPDPCSVCPSRCCRWSVRASVADVVRFCVVLNVPYWAGFRLARAYGPEAFVIDEPLPEWVDPGDGELRAEFVLHRDDAGNCAHLMDLGGHYRCGVYDARPTPCRLYPISWTSRDRTGGPPMVLCPAPFGVSPRQEEEIRAEIARSIEGWRIHAQVRTEWESTDVEGPRTGAQMTRFVLTRAAELLGEAPEVLLDPRNATQRMQDAMTARSRTSKPDR